MEKKTSLQWFLEQLEKTTGKSIISVLSDEIATAKDMEKEQIMDAWIFGKEDDKFGYHIMVDAEKYYEETYNKQK